MLKILSSYARVERHIWLLIGAELAIKCIDAAFFILFNYHLKKIGYTDTDIGEIIANRYAAVFLLAFPLGLLVKGRSLKPLFYVTAFTLPLLSLLLVYAVDTHNWFLISWSMRFWGASFMLLAVAGLPYLMLNSKPETHSEGISLYFQAGGLAIFFAGTINALLQYINPAFFDERTVMQCFSLFGFISIYLLWKIDIVEQPTEHISLKDTAKAYDWGKIAMVSIPTLLIAVGAGFTIPFMNLFFMNIHGIPSSRFSELAAIANVTASLSMLFIPAIRRRFGYQIAITLFQILAIICLLLMATTEYYAAWSGAVIIAIVCYILRQPLMNVASPMASELSMHYVGEQNREMVSSLNASIWSGSWFLSGVFFSVLRNADLRYVTIFMITVVLYLAGTLWYAWLIKHYERQQRRIGGLEDEHLMLRAKIRALTHHEAPPASPTADSVLER